MLTFRSFAVGGVGVVLAACVPAQAGLTYVSQSRQVEALVGFGTPDENSAQDVDRASAPGFGPFSGDVSAAFTVDNDGDAQSARATQVSRLDENSITARGRVERESDDELAIASSRLDVSFETAADVDYQLDLVSRFFEVDNRLGPDRELVSVRLARLDAGGGESVLFDESIGTNEASASSESELAQSGRLTAGRYRLQFDGLVEPELGGSDEAFEYDLSFVTQGDDNGGPNPIPLPPAAFAGGAVMLGMGARRALRRRRGA